MAKYSRAEIGIFQNLESFHKKHPLDTVVIVKNILTWFSRDAGRGFSFLLAKFSVQISWICCVILNILHISRRNTRKLCILSFSHGYKPWEWPDPFDLSSLPSCLDACGVVLRSPHCWIGPAPKLTWTTCDPETQTWLLPVILTFIPRT